MSILTIQNLSFKYDEQTTIFDGITIDFDNRTTAIIGQNGAGKTTLVKLIKGLLMHQSGTILYENQDIAAMKAAEVAKYIGLVFQNPDDQIFKHNVLEEVMFGPTCIGFSLEESKKAAETALIEVGLEAKVNENPYDLSLSDRKMIAIASIIAMNTNIVIFDEPTIAQDYAGKKRIKKIIRRLQNEGKLVITIIHDMDFVADCFERTIVLAKGKVLIDAPTREVFKEKEILQTAHLDLPYITELGQQLGYDEIFLTIDDFLENK